MFYYVCVLIHYNMTADEKQTIKILTSRLKHQSGEVREAKKNLGKSPAFTKAYLNRMMGNAKQTKKMLAALKKKAK